MRKKRNNQLEFDFQPPRLGVTQEYFERYEKISQMLDDNRRIIDLAHEDLKEVLTSQESGERGGRECAFTTETVVRMVVAQIMEGESLRRIVVRVDDSNYLRRFVRIYNGPMMDFSTLCTLRNAIQPRTWKKINLVLTKAAVEDGLISGERMRIDTTAYETNIRWPSDSGLLWDTYRVLSRLINDARWLDPDVASGRRLQQKRAKRLYTKISRRSRNKGVVSKHLRLLYKPLIALVEDVLDLALSACKHFERGLRSKIYCHIDDSIRNLTKKLNGFRQLGMKVVDQARRRVLEGEKVPNDEKLFSIFEPHTELLKRGKAGKPIEFGHMIAIQQVDGRFITGYEVFERKPNDHTLVDPALRQHRKIFGDNPEEFSADKGFYENARKITELENEIAVVSIGKKGSRTEEETLRETSSAFRRGQRFRAGVEGTISVLKRALGLARCMNKGWQHYTSTVGAIVFTHNLLNLAGYG